jgi:hypothetical protein
MTHILSSLANLILWSCLGLMCWFMYLCVSGAI